MDLSVIYCGDILRIYRGSAGESPNRVQGVGGSACCVRLIVFCHRDSPSHRPAVQKRAAIHTSVQTMNSHPLSSPPHGCEITQAPGFQRRTGSGSRASQGFPMGRSKTTDMREGRCGESWLGSIYPSQASRTLAHTYPHNLDPNSRGR